MIGHSVSASIPNQMIKNRSQVVLTFICVTLLATNIFLILQNRELKNQMERSRQPVIEEGNKFSVLNFLSLDGNEEVIDLASGDTKTLLFVLNSSCEYCKQQYPHWRNLVQNLEGKDWRVLAISSETDRERLKAHLDEQGLLGLKIGTVAATDMRRARMMFTPLTIAVDANGEVTRVWPGLWTKDFEFR